MTKFSIYFSKQYVSVQSKMIGLFYFNPVYKRFFKNEATGLRKTSSNWSGCNYLKATLLTWGYVYFLNPFQSSSMLYGVGYVVLPLRSKGKCWSDCKLKGIRAVRRYDEGAGVSSSTWVTFRQLYEALSLLSRILKLLIWICFVYFYI